MVVFRGLMKPLDALKTLKEVLKSPRVPYNILARGPPQYPNKLPELPASDGGSHTNTIKQHFLTPRVHTIMQGAVTLLV